MSAAERILAQLAGGRPISERVVIVAAHPDDETLGIGAQLCRLADALLVHLTDGAPRDGEDARNYGFADTAAYAAARRAELAAALEAGGAARLRTLCFGISDKEAMHDLAGLTRRLADLLRAERPTAIFTHAYEGGHPDHDAAAFAAHAACRLIGEPPAILEMPFYHRRDGRLVTGEFLRSRRRQTCFTLSPEDRRRKQAMVDCFATQRWLLARFDISAERFRPALADDFGAPPHPGTLHYETLGWGISGADWRRAAMEAMDRLGL